MNDKYRFHATSYKIEDMETTMQRSVKIHTSLAAIVTVFATYMLLGVERASTAGQRQRLNPVTTVEHNN